MDDTQIEHPVHTVHRPAWREHLVATPRGAAPGELAEALTMPAPARLLHAAGSAAGVGGGIAALGVWRTCSIAMGLTAGLVVG